MRFCVGGSFPYCIQWITNAPPRTPCVERNHYEALLRRNYIAMHATVMYRRAIFQAVGEFNTSLQACEDYDLYLRIAARVPVYCHDKVVAVTGSTMRI